MKDINYVFFGKIFVSSVNFLIFIFLARNMELSEYGLYSFSLAYSGIVNLIIFQFIRHAVVRFGIVDMISLSKLYSMTINITAIMLVFIFLSYLTTNNFYYYLIAGVSLGLFEISQEINRAKEDNKNLIKNAFFRTLLFFIIILLLECLDILTVKMTVLAFSIPYLILAIKQLYSYRTLYMIKVDFRFFRQILFYTLPITLSSGMSYIVDYFDRYYINKLLNADDLGIYSGIYTLSQQSVGVILMTLNFSFYPLIVKAFETDNEKYIEFRSKYFSIIIMFICAICLFSSLFSDDIINIVLGEDFKTGAKAFIIIIFAICLGCLKSYYFDIYYLLEKKTKFLLYNAVISALVNIYLNILLIPLYGIDGAAMATCLTFCIAIIISFCFSKKDRLNIKPIYKSLGVSIASIVLVCSYILVNKIITLVPSDYDYIASAVIVFTLTILGFRSLTKK